MYLEQMPGDPTGWQELVDIYLSLSKYDAAAFCCEELILHDPMNHLLHCRLAEIYFTMGSAHVPNARKYFSQSLEIKKKNNPRALYGLALCCQAMSEEPTLMNENKKEVSEALHHYARTELTLLYKQNNQMSEAVEEILNDQEKALE
eukprot:CAMPEP_0114336438 /NCGR_PEP_ID=MMETSP0101-20121206/5709_1 /TAXON_ID=38822 ORGANISM="Pteridomonas danica, Strain PT" /NCGR_SAMPLE_ID=MMETSP0101 /ASSEMBLY_ACC=CAM_ASM_000211 /LENGTH=146 /DNA_ID=CAMNT_0001468365 /DNA_START=442 /DNA_END=882 /DNA_ORIENTATION=-